MRRFTPFTLIYIAAAVCLTAIAFQHTVLSASLKKSLLVNAGLLYLFAILSTFRFWHQSALNRQSRLRNQPVWKQKLVAITPWLLIAITLFSFILAVLAYHWTTAVIAQAVSGLTLILLCVEWLFTRHQIQ
jgi:hypothetical protein